MPLVTKSFANAVTFTRASSATYFDSTGVLQTAITNTSRLDYDPSTLAARGILIEEQRTNSIRNNTMVGAVAGTPGTAPTNWTRTASPSNGISSEIVGVGTETGITYIDIRFSGTCTSSFSFSIVFDTSSSIAASPSQTWTASAFVKLQAGTLNGSFFQYVLNEYNSVPTFLRNTFSAAVTPTSAGLATQRTSAVVTTGASTAFVQPIITPAFSNGLTYDFTLRIGLPQLELGAFATSVIATTTAAATRSVDVASVNINRWFNDSDGTFFCSGILEGSAAGFPYQLAAVGSNPDTDAIGILWHAPSGTMRGGIRVNNIQTFDQSAIPAKVAGNSFRAAIAYALNNSNFASEGSVGTDDTAVTLPTVQSLRINGQASYQINGSTWIQRIKYYPRRLTNAELQTLTT